MTQRYRAAILVHPVHIGVKFFFPGKHYRSKRLVDLDKVDVIDRHAGTLQHLRRCGNRCSQHEARVSPRKREVDKTCPRGQAKRRRFFFTHDEQRRCTIGDLTRVTSRYSTTIFFSTERRLEVTQRLHCRVTQTLIDRHHLAISTEHRQNLAFETTFIGGPTSEFLATHPVAVEIFTT